MSNSIEDSINSTGIVGGKRDRTKAPETYFNTLWEGLEEWYEYLARKAEQKGFGVPEKALSELTVDSMYAGQNQVFSVPYVDGKGSHAMLISIYKRDEGVKVYEVTAYNA